VTRQDQVEREVKIGVPDRFRLPPLDDIGQTTVVAGATRRSTTTYYDTEDLVLAGWGCVLRYRGGEGWTVKLRGAPDGPVLTRMEHTFPAPPGGAPPSDALDLLRAYLRERPVGVSARSRTDRRRLLFTDRAGSELAAVVDDRTVAIDPVPGRRFRQLEIEVLAEEGAELIPSILRRLRDAGAGPPGGTTKYAWVLGERLPRSPEIVIPPVSADTSAADVVRAAIGAAVTLLLDHDAVVRAGQDPEGVHQARVATRRLRAHLRAFADVLEPETAPRLRDELAWLAELLGAVRDTDVLSDRLRSAGNELPEPGAVRSVVSLLDRGLEQARSALLEALAGPRYLTLLDQLVTYCRSGVLPRAADLPAAELLLPAVRQTWSRLRREVREAGKTPSDERLHSIRIRAKRARYAGEALAPIVGKRADAYARAAARLQTVLGEHQDAVVTWTWLRENAQEGRIEGFTAGQLGAVQTRDRTAARRSWRAAWKATRQKRPGTWR